MDYASEMVERPIKVFDAIIFNNLMLYGIRENIFV